MSNIWQSCIKFLENELSQDELETWINPLQAHDTGSSIVIFAPNEFVLSYINKNHIDKIKQSIAELTDDKVVVEMKLGSNLNCSQTPFKKKSSSKAQQPDDEIKASSTTLSSKSNFNNNLNYELIFDNHVQGKSNQLARAASTQVGINPGNKDYNPLFIYGGVGLGKTHLMQAAGNAILNNNSKARVYYIHSERFVAEYVKALQEGRINQFKQHYRSLDALLIDDIQFFAGKQGSQEEFFHTFNQLFESKSQIIITSDCIPKDLDGVEERLISRFSMGLAIPIDPPELETRVAILNAKAKHLGIHLPEEVGFFIAKQIRSNVRELEGALNRVNADSKFMGKEIDLSLAKDALKDILLYHERKITIDYIQKRIAEYYNLRIADLLSKKRNQPIARARQMAMKCAKELTNHSLPEIGDAFGGRDHTTVLHACRKIDELNKTDSKTNEDFNNLIRILGG